MQITEHVLCYRLSLSVRQPAELIFSLSNDTEFQLYCQLQQENFREMFTVNRLQFGVGSRQPVMTCILTLNHTQDPVTYEWR